MTWFWTFWMSKKKPTLGLNLFMTWKHFLQRYFSYWLFQIIYYIIDGTLFVYFVAQQSIILINKNKWIFVYSFSYISLSICIYQNLTCNKDLQITKALWVGCACSFSTMKSRKAMIENNEEIQFTMSVGDTSNKKQPQHPKVAWWIDTQFEENLQSFVHEIQQRSKIWANEILQCPWHWHRTHCWTCLGSISMQARDVLDYNEEVHHKT